MMEVHLSLAVVGRRSLLATLHGCAPLMELGTEDICGKPSSRLLRARSSTDWLWTIRYPSSQDCFLPFGRGKRPHYSCGIVAPDELIR